MATFTDDFTRADGALGANWTVFPANLTISSNLVVGTSATDLYALWSNTFQVDQFAEVDATVSGTGSKEAYVGVRLTGTSAANVNGYVGLWDTAGNYIINRVTAGAWTAIATSTTNGNTGTRRLRITAIANTITLFVDGVQKLQVVDSTYRSGVPGMGTWYDTASGTLDNYAGGDAFGTANGTGYVLMSNSPDKLLLSNGVDGLLLPAGSGGPTSHPITASGSTTTTGSADVRAQRPVTGSGATTTTGTANIVIPRPITASGSTTTDGSAAINTNRPITASGATTTLGSANVIAIRPITASGSTTTDGSAAINISSGAVSHPITASGATTTDGTAQPRLRSALSANGSTIITGTLTQQLTQALSATGTTTTTGSAAINVTSVNYKLGTQLISLRLGTNAVDISIG